MTEQYAIIRTKTIPHIASETGHDYPLGRHVNHDSRSLRYAWASTGERIGAVKHVRQIPILDQGNLGSCVGNAGTGVLGTDPFPQHLPPGHSLAELTEAHAVKLYSDCTKVDPYAGTYPPTDTGTDGLTCAQVLKARPWIIGYQHVVTGVNDALNALSLYPVMTGISWWSSFDNPSSDGVITKTSNAYVRGGHEIVVNEYDPIRGLVWCDNSWGIGFGLGGRFAMSVDLWGELLADDGDVTVMLPLNVPPPVPPAPPVPDPDDLAFWIQCQAWARKKKVI